MSRLQTHYNLPRLSESCVFSLGANPILTSTQKVACLSFVDQNARPTRIFEKTSCLLNFNTSSCLNRIFEQVPRSAGERGRSFECAGVFSAAGGRGERGERARDANTSLARILPQFFPSFDF